MFSSTQRPVESLDCVNVRSSGTKLKLKNIYIPNLSRFTLSLKANVVNGYDIVI